MNNILAHAHVVLSHFPIVLSLIGTVLYILSFHYKQLRFTALILLIIAGIIILFVPFTGEEAEHFLIDSGINVSREDIKAHEEGGEMARNIMVITAFVACFELYGSALWSRYKTACTIFLTVLCILSAVSLCVVGYTGGKIRHTEFVETL